MHTDLHKLVQTFYQILNTSLKNCLQTFKMLHKWRNFANSGHIDCGTKISTSFFDGNATQLVIVQMKTGDDT